MAVKDYAVMFRGRRACPCLAEWLPAFEAELIRRGVIKKNIDIAQLIGGASASAGTHTTGGAFDIWQHDKVTIEVARNMGAVTWARTRAQGFSPHAHGVLRGCPHNGAARYQIAAADKGGNGLGAGGMGGKDDGKPKPPPKRTWSEGIAWAEAQSKPAPVVVTPAKATMQVTADPFLWGLAAPGSGNEKKGKAEHGTVLDVDGYATVDKVRWWRSKGLFYSGTYLRDVTGSPTVPDEPLRLKVATFNPSDKLGNTDARAKLVADSIYGSKTGVPDVVGFQELGGRKGEGVPSDWAAKISKALNAREPWRLFVPTTNYNENYVAIRLATVEHVRVLADKILPRYDGAAGKHCSRVVVRHKASGRNLLLGDCHLDVKASDSGVSKQALDAWLSLKAAYDEQPVPIADFILVGDFNMPKFPSTLTARNVRSAFAVAAKTVNANRESFTGSDYGIGDAPHIDWICPHENDTVHVAENVLITNAAGTQLAKPKAGDHNPLLADITFH